MNKKFASLGTVLNRAQAKRIVGGLDDSGTWSCKITLTNGTTKILMITANNGTAAQCAADSFCWDNDNCSNADCENSGACL